MIEQADTYIYFFVCFFFFVWACVANLFCLVCGLVLSVSYVLRRGTTHALVSSPISLRLLSESNPVGAMR